MPLVRLWFRAFVWTVLIEQIAARIVLGREWPPWRRFSIVLVCNLASHPAVWLIFPEIGSARGWPHYLTLFSSEVWAFGLEAWIYWLFLGAGRGRTAWLVAIVANGASLSLGFGLRALGLA